jgi:D-amino-acid dehydrogenase
LRYSPITNQGSTGRASKAVARSGRVVVVGGGVVGLCCAWALERRGAAVTVVDAGPRDHSASHVNAGWIVPSLAEPVPAPGLVGQSLRWMLRPDSPLYVAPRLDPGFLRWLLAFWRSCNAPSYRAATEATAAFGVRTMELFDALRADGVAFEEHRDGLLFAYRDPAALRHDHAGLEPLRPFGYPIPPLLSGAEARALEPALSDAIVGGFWLERERSVRPDSLVSGLLDRLEAAGTEVRLGETVVGLSASGGVVRTVVTDRGTLPAEAVVVAAVRGRRGSSPRSGSRRRWRRARGTASTSPRRRRCRCHSAGRSTCTRRGSPSHRSTGCSAWPGRWSSPA